MFVSWTTWTSSHTLSSTTKLARLVPLNPIFDIAWCEQRTRLLSRPSKIFVDLGRLALSGKNHSSHCSHILVLSVNCIKSCMQMLWSADKSLSISISYRPDARDALYHTYIYEFLWIYWHGYPEGHSKFNDVRRISSNTGKKTRYKELSEKTMERLYIIKSLGYSISYV